MQKLNMVDYRFRILYALGIIFVVAGHCYPGISFFSEVFPYYAFHLALFAFCSGYFYKNPECTGVGKYIWKKIKHLVIPMYVWNFVYAGVVTLLSLKGFTIGTGVNFEKLFIEPITTGHQFGYNLGAWFIVPLFMLEVFTVVFRKVLNKIFHLVNEYFFFSIYLILGFIGVYLAAHGFNKDWWLVLVRMLYFFPFFAFGILYKSNLEKYDKINNSIYFLTLLFLQMFITTWVGRSISYSAAWCNEFRDGFALPFLMGLLGIAFWLRIARILESVIGRSRIINTIACNTYVIMVNHLIGFMFVKYLYYLLHRYSNVCTGFDVAAFKTNIWYAYYPNHMPISGMLYLAAGLAFPLLIQLLITNVRNLPVLVSVRQKD